MYIDSAFIIQTASLIGASGVIIGLIFSFFKWYTKQKQIESDIKEIKKEQCLLTYGILACLKGLKEQGCNGPVTESIIKLEKHLNQKAHDINKGGE